MIYSLHETTRLHTVWVHGTCHRRAHRGNGSAGCLREPANRFPSTAHCRRGRPSHAGGVHGAFLERDPTDALLPTHLPRLHRAGGVAAGRRRVAAGRPCHQRPREEPRRGSQRPAEVCASEYPGLCATWQPRPWFHLHAGALQTRLQNTWLQQLVHP